MFSVESEFIDPDTEYEMSVRVVYWSGFATEPTKARVRTPKTSKLLSPGHLNSLAGRV